MKASKVIVCLFTAVALAAAVFGCAKVEPKKAEVVESTAEEKKADSVNATTQESEKIVVEIVIDGSKGEDKAISCNGKLELPSGATAYDALKQFCDSEGYEITGDPSYVKTIGGLGEGSFGAAPCGWMFSVDGEYGSSPADECILEGGNTVSWEFMK